MTRSLPLAVLALAALSTAASAIVIRHDVDDAKYLIPASEAPAVADMPGEGHGVLIAPEWIVTAAHAVTWQHEVSQVMLNGTARDVERIIIHPGYTAPSQALAQQAMATWDWTLFRLVLASSDDIALIKLKQSVTDVAPLVINRADSEYGEVVTIIGKGAHGTGETGYEFNSSHRTALRRAQNTITSAHGRWMCYIFDEPSAGLPLEGGSGSGDSGGPVLLSSGLVAGLTSWVDPQSTIRTPGRYGQISCNIRLSHYAPWIDGIIADAGRGE
jgi:hypothetical protein